MNRRARGLSLIEVLTAVTLVTILLALLIPTMSSARIAAETAVCANRLHRLSTAAVQHKIESKAPLNSGVWPEQLAPYLQGAYESLVCPTDSDPGRSEPPRASLEVHPANRTANKPPLQTMPLRPNAMTLMGGTPRPTDQKRLGEAPALDAEGQRTYELWFENGFDDGDRPDDYDDVTIRITELPGKRHRLEARAEAGPRTYDLIDPRGVVLYRQLPTAAITLELEGGQSSYGMNRETDGMPNELYDEPMVFLLDYPMIRANVNPAERFGDDWNRWTTETGQASFARHEGRCNVLYLQGNVALSSPWELDPQIEAYRRRWVPAPRR